MIHEPPGGRPGTWSGGNEMSSARIDAGRICLAVLAVVLGSMRAWAAEDVFSPGADRGGEFSLQLQGRKIAAVVFPQNQGAKSVLQSTQSRFESILVDNDVTVLDEKKAGELKNVCKGLDDPAAFITPEAFIENAEKFHIQALAAIYVYADVSPGLADYYSATAHASIRVIDNKDATVKALATLPMGIPGKVPSDGLTANSALMNAVYRAMDEACEKMKLRVADMTKPRTIRLALEGPVASVVAPAPGREPENDAVLARMASFESKKWRSEEATCTARSPDGNLAAVAGYIKDTDMHRNPSRLYGSRVHLLDPKTRRTIHVMECSPVEKKTRAESGTKQVLDCMFVSSWRYLAAVTGNHIYFWDTETGQSLKSTPLPRAAESAVLGFARIGDASFVTVQADGKSLAYRVVCEK